MDYLNFFKSSFKYYYKIFYKYNYEHYIGYSIELEDISEMQVIINTYNQCHWKVQIYPPTPQYIYTDSLCKKETCSICFNPEMDTKTNCLHYFHFTCIDRWLKINPECPVCRTKLLPNNLYRVTYQICIRLTKLQTMEL